MAELIVFWYYIISMKHVRVFCILKFLHRFLYCIALKFSFTSTVAVSCTRDFFLLMIEENEKNDSQELTTEDVVRPRSHRSTHKREVERYKRRQHNRDQRQVATERDSKLYFLSALTRNADQLTLRPRVPGVECHLTVLEHVGLQGPASQLLCASQSPSGNCRNELISQRLVGTMELSLNSNANPENASPLTSSPSTIYVHPDQAKPALPVRNPLQPGRNLNVAPNNFLSIEETFRVYQHAPGFRRDVLTALPMLVARTGSNTIVSLDEETDSFSREAEGIMAYPVTCTSLAATSRINNTDIRIACTSNVLREVFQLSHSHRTSHNTHTFYIYRWTENVLLVSCAEDMQRLGRCSKLSSDALREKALMSKLLYNLLHEKEEEETRSRPSELLAVSKRRTPLQPTDNSSDLPVEELSKRIGTKAGTHYLSTPGAQQYSRTLVFDIGSSREKMTICAGVDSPIVFDVVTGKDTLLKIVDDEHVSPRRGEVTPLSANARSRNVPVSSSEASSVIVSSHVTEKAAVIPFMDSDPLASWFEAFIAGAEVVGLYTHRRGVIQRYQTRNVEDIQSLVPPQQLNESIDFAVRFFGFLKENCKSMGKEYVLTPDWDQLKLRLSINDSCIKDDVSTSCVSVQPGFGQPSGAPRAFVRSNWKDACVAHPTHLINSSTPLCEALRKAQTSLEEIFRQRESVMSSTVDFSVVLEVKLETRKRNEQTMRGLLKRFLIHIVALEDLFNGDDLLIAWQCAIFGDFVFLLMSDCYTSDGVCVKDLCREIVLADERLLRHSEEAIQSTVPWLCALLGEEGTMENYAHSALLFYEESERLCTSISILPHSKLREPRFHNSSLVDNAYWSTWIGFRKVQVHYCLAVMYRKNANLRKAMEMLRQAASRLQAAFSDYPHYSLFLCPPLSLVHLPPWTIFAMRGIIGAELVYMHLHCASGNQIHHHTTKGNEYSMMGSHYLLWSPLFSCCSPDLEALETLEESLEASLLSFSDAAAAFQLYDISRKTPNRCDNWDTADQPSSCAGVGTLKKDFEQFSLPFACSFASFVGTSAGSMKNLRRNYNQLMIFLRYSIYACFVLNKSGRIHRTRSFLTLLHVLWSARLLGNFSHLSSKSSLIFDARRYSSSENFLSFLAPQSHMYRKTRDPNSEDSLIRFSTYSATGLEDAEREQQLYFLILFCVNSTLIEHASQESMSVLCHAAQQFVDATVSALSFRICPDLSHSQCYPLSHDSVSLTQITSELNVSDLRRSGVLLPLELSYSMTPNTAELQESQAKKSADCQSSTLSTVFFSTFCFSSGKTSLFSVEEEKTHLQGVSCLLLCTRCATALLDLYSRKLAVEGRSEISANMGEKVDWCTAFFQCMDSVLALIVALLKDSPPSSSHLEREKGFGRRVAVADSRGNEKQQLESVILEIVKMLRVSLSLMLDVLQRHRIQHKVNPAADHNDISLLRREQNPIWSMPRQKIDIAFKYRCVTGTHSCNFSGLTLRGAAYHVVEIPCRWSSCRAVDISDLSDRVTKLNPAVSRPCDENYHHILLELLNIVSLATFRSA